MADGILEEPAGRAGVAAIRAALAENGLPASAVAAAAGVAADVLEPFAPLAAWLCLLGAAAAGLFALALFLRPAAAARLAAPAVFAGLLAAVTGGIWQLQHDGAGRGGVTATLVPAVARLQHALGLVGDAAASGADAAAGLPAPPPPRAAAAATEAPPPAAARSAAPGDAGGTRTAHGADDPARALADGQRRIDAPVRGRGATGERVADAGPGARPAEAAPTAAVAPEARAAAEVYRTARSAETGGDAFAARRAYLQLAALDPDAIDAWSRLAALLRVQDGRTGARDVFAGLAGRAHAPAYELVAATLSEDAERRRRIETFVAMRPDYGPGWYLLADEVSEARLGSQTLSEKRRERDALARFLGADAVGTLGRHFLDASMLAQWLDDARRRLTRLEAGLAGAQTEPRAIFTRTSGDWSVYVQLPEPATGFAYRLGSDGPFIPSGPGFGSDPRTGRPMPNTSITVMPGAEPTAIEITYLDLRGQEVGPFRIPFDPMSALVGQQKQALEMTKGSWVSFRDYNGLLVYTTHLVTYRCTIRRATYGLDSQPVDRPLPLPACDARDPFAVPSSETPWFKVPPTTRSMTVRLEFRDGTASESTVFRR